MTGLRFVRINILPTLRVAEEDGEGRKEVLLPGRG